MIVTFYIFETIILVNIANKTLSNKDDLESLWSEAAKTYSALCR